jgi:hypothetical protein
MAALKGGVIAGVSAAIGQGVFMAAGGVGASGGQLFSASMASGTATAAFSGAVAAASGQSAGQAFLLGFASSAAGAGIGYAFRGSMTAAMIGGLAIAGLGAVVTNGNVGAAMVGAFLSMYANMAADSIAASKGLASSSITAEVHGGHSTLSGGFCSVDGTMTSYIIDSTPEGPIERAMTYVQTDNVPIQVSRFHTQLQASAEDTVTNHTEIGFYGNTDTGATYAASSADASSSYNTMAVNLLSRNDGKYSCSICSGGTVDMVGHGHPHTYKLTEHTDVSYLSSYQDQAFSNDRNILIVSATKEGVSWHFPGQQPFFDRSPNQDNNSFLQSIMPQGVAYYHVY